MPDPLLDHHRQFLHDRGLTDEVIAARGYSSTTIPRVLREAYRFPSALAAPEHVPGLLIPVFDCTGKLRFHQYRPDCPRVVGGKPRKYEIPAGVRLVVDVPPAVRGRLGDPSVPLYWTESPVKADAAVSHGLTCVGLIGAMGWRGRNRYRAKAVLSEIIDGAIAHEGRWEYLVPDSDVRDNDNVAYSISRFGQVLAGRDANVRYVILPHGPDGRKQGLDDFTASESWCLAGSIAAALRELEDDELPRRDARKGDARLSGTPPVKPAPDAPAMTMAQVEAVYARWLHDGDSVTTRAVHAVYVANMMLAGDPVWVFLVGGSGQGKTERLAPLAVMPHVELASTLSGEAALLSATPRRDRAEHAHGGLLRRIGEKGVLLVKDFTSVLEMDHVARGQVLAALREVFDGRWDRVTGAEGGQTLTWQGKCGLLAASTTAIDRAHAVMSDMGPRSLFVRLAPADPGAIGRSALNHMGREETMRAELAAATAGLLTHLTGSPHDTGPVTDALVGLAALVAAARSPVHRDWAGEVELVGDPEAPTRIVKQLGQLWRACGVLGLGRAESWEVVRRCALDSVPKLRGAVIRYLTGCAGPATTTDVRIALSHPKKTVLRALEDLAAHGVITRKSAGQGHADLWELAARARSWTSAAQGVPEMLEPSPCAVCGLPMDPVLTAATGWTTHPDCAPEDGPGRQAGAATERKRE